MKKILLLIMILFFSLFSLFAIQEYSAIPISFAVNMDVFAGFSSQHISSSARPTSDITELGFHFSSASNQIESDTFYVYCISFLTKAVDVYVSTTGPLKSNDSSITSTIPWTSTDTNLSSSMSGEYKLLSDMRTSFSKPEILQRQIALFVKLDDLPDTGDNFTTTITMEVRSR